MIRINEAARPRSWQLQSKSCELKIKSLTAVRIHLLRKDRPRTQDDLKKCRRHSGKSNPDENANDLVTS